MKIYLIADTHFNHDNIKTYCQRPDNYHELLIRNWRQTVQPTDVVIHLGDVFINKPDGWEEIYPQLTGRKILIRGNHDYNRSCAWWMEHGFDFAADSMIFRHCYLTHHPQRSLPEGAELNIHGHLHNAWHGFLPNNGRPYMRERRAWQRLFAVEYTGYKPIEFDKFVSHPKKYLSMGPEDEQ